MATDESTEAGRAFEARAHPPGAAPDAPRPPRATASWLIALFTGAFAVSCTEFVPVGLLPQIADDLSVSESAAGQLVTTNAIAFAIGAPLLAAVFAKTDRRRVLLATLSLFAVSHLMAGLAPNFAVLMLSRVLSGAMMGLYLATALTVAARLAAPERRARSMATIVAGVSTATALGVPVSTVLGHGAGWRVPMLGISALALLALGLVATAVTKSGTDDGPSLRVRFTALRNRTVLVGLGAIMTFWAASFTVYTYVVPLLEDRAGIHGALVTLTLFLAGLGAVGGNLIGGRSADAQPRRTLIVTTGVTTLALFAALPATTTPAAAIALIAVWQLAAWSFVPAVQSVLYQAAGPGGDLAVSFAISGFNVGIVAGAGLGGVALDTGGLSAVVLLGAALAVIATAFVAALVARRRPRQGEREGLRQIARQDTGQDTGQREDTNMASTAGTTSRTAAPSLPPTERHFDAVLFDMDGTLLDSRAAVVRAWRQWAVSEGVPPELVSRSTGRPAKEIVADLVPADRVQESLAAYLRIASSDVEGVAVLPGAGDALASARPRTAIVTSSTRAVARARLAAAGLDEPDLMITAEDSARGKPAPDPYLLAAERLGLDPARCLAVEDSATGLASARAAGCTTLGLTHDDAPDSLTADLLATDLSRLSFHLGADGVALRTAPMAVPQPDPLTT
ncbi:MFS transporter [Streptomyces sp. NRRL B-1347]|uniref:MFS transporter n=1 Tax=Streptomyces sp. NRRL B-1347 TaxID=1476877 RepID=UPI00068C003B|nr:MFS transporter [Streptomyces sp. NRRL B-1347]